MYLRITDNGMIDHQVFGFTVDSIKIMMAREPLGIKPKQACIAGDYHLEDGCFPRGKSMEELIEPYQNSSVAPTKPWTSVAKCDIDLEHGCLFVGAGGCGKSTKIVDLVKQVHSAGKKYVVLSYTCASVQNIVCSCRPDEGAHAFTFDAYFNAMKTETKSISDASKLDYIFVEEFSSIPERFMHKLYQVKMTNPSVKFFYSWGPESVPSKRSLVGLLS